MDTYQSQREYLEYYIPSNKQEKPADLQGISSSRTFKKNHNGSKAETNKINKCTKRTRRQVQIRKLAVNLKRIILSR